VLTPEQEARCLVGSYPYHPDVVKYSAILARELGDASAHAPILTPDAPLELTDGARVFSFPICDGLSRRRRPRARRSVHEPRAAPAAECLCRGLGPCCGASFRG